MKTARLSVATISGFLLFAVLFLSGLDANGHYLDPNMLDTIRRATVAILNQDAPTLKSSVPRFTIRGTGIHLKDGYILTAQHVGISEEYGIQSVQQKITVLTDDLYELEAHLVGEVEFTDVVLYRLGVEDRPLMSATVDFAADDPLSGEDIFVPGFPLNFGFMETFGHIGNTNVYLPTVQSRLIQMDIPECSGYSGAGVFNESGKIVGLMHAIIQTENIQGLGGCSRYAFAIPAKLLARVTRELMIGKKPVFSLLGIGMEAVKHKKRWMIKVESVKGPAHAAGLKAGDIITKVNDVAVRDAAHFKSMVVESTKPGESVLLRVLRDGKELIISIRAGGS